VTNQLVDFTFVLSSSISESCDEALEKSKFVDGGKLGYKCSTLYYWDDVIGRIQLCLIHVVFYDQIEYTKTEYI